LRHLQTSCFVIAALCLWSATGRAAQFTLGGFAGVSQSNLKGDKPPGGSYKGRTGPVVGVEGGIYIKPDIAIVVQPHFIQRGAVVEFRDSQNQKTGPDIDLRFDYLEIPVAARFEARTNVKPYALGGISLGILLKAEREVEGMPTEDLKSDVESLDVNAIVGVGILFPVKSFLLFGEFRYTQGLRNVSVNVDSASPQDKVRLKNVGTQLLAGILFPFGRP
jgi:hypothetical protein